MVKNLIGLSRDELAAEMVGIGEKPFRAKQIWQWIYHWGVTDFEAMTNIAKPLRARLAELYEMSRPEVAREQISNDGTRKWLLLGEGGGSFESVHIPEEDRGALCISTQVGCTLNCAFCHTGTQALERDLNAREIVGQMMVARDSYQEWPSPEEDRMLSNLVVMGMGEPLLNYDEVAKALKIIMDPEGLAVSKRKVTLSTSGIVPMIAKVGEELGVGLAISLHAVTDELRDLLVPINRKYPIRQLLAACRAYPGASNARRITFEYVMLKGVNDSPADARALAGLLRTCRPRSTSFPSTPGPARPTAAHPTGGSSAFPKSSTSAACRPPSGCREGVTLTPPAAN